MIAVMLVIALGCAPDTDTYTEVDTIDLLPDEGLVVLIDEVEVFRCVAEDVVATQSSYQEDARTDAWCYSDNNEDHVTLGIFADVDEPGVWYPPIARLDLMLDGLPVTSNTSPDYEIAITAMEPMEVQAYGLLPGAPPQRELLIVVRKATEPWF